MTVILEVKDIVTRFRMSGEYGPCGQRRLIQARRTRDPLRCRRKRMRQERHDAVVVTSDPGASR